MGYFMRVAECVANGFFLPYFSISLDQIQTKINSSNYRLSFTILNLYIKKKINLTKHLSVQKLIVFLVVRNIK